MRWLIAKIIGNFGIVCSGIYRSGQTWHMFALWPFLRLKTVINLSAKPEKELQDRFERWFCEKLGITLVEFYTIGPTHKFKDAYKALVDSEKPVLVHCEGGCDRTGGLIGLYKKTDLKREYTDIVKDWPIYGTPGEEWLHWFFMYLEGF